MEKINKKSQLVSF